MVRLVLSPHRGNHTRLFPHTGYLGLTPVSLQGYVKCELEEDKLPLEATRVEIRLRCYESESKGTGTGGKARDLRVLYEVNKVLWASGTADFKPLGDFQAKFRLTVPVDALLHGALSSVHFKSWRIWWSLEAVVHHKALPTFGDKLMKSAPLQLVSFAYPPPARHLAWSNTDSVATPLLQYTAETDSDHYGPGQSVTLSLRLKKTELDPALALKKITVEFRREITYHSQNLHTRSYDSTPSDDSDMPLTPLDEDEGPHGLNFSPVSGDWSSLSSARPSADDSVNKQFSNAVPGENPYFIAESNADSAPLLIKNSSRSKKEDISLFSRSLVGSELSFDSSGGWQGQLTGLIPKSKTVYHWSVGETCNTPTFSVRFYVAVQIYVKSRFASLVDLPCRDVTFQCIVAEERAVARDQVPKILAIQAAESRLFDPSPGAIRRCASTDSASFCSSTTVATPMSPRETLGIATLEDEARNSFESAASSLSASRDSDTPSFFKSRTNSSGSSMSLEPTAQPRRASLFPDSHGLTTQAPIAKRILSHLSSRRNSSSIALHLDQNTPTTPTKEFEQFNFSNFALPSKAASNTPTTIIGGCVVSEKRKSSKHGHSRRKGSTSIGPTETYSFTTTPFLLSQSVQLEEQKLFERRQKPSFEEAPQLFSFLRRGSKTSLS